MRICYLADGASIHTQRWCRHFAMLGHEIHLLTLTDVKIDGVIVHHLDSGRISKDGGNWRSLLKTGEVRRLLAQVKPDILHALYATSYGTLGALSGFHPFVVTALGSDVLVSPQKSLLYRQLVRFALGRADWVTAMSEPMSEIMRGLGVTANKISTVIFGIDPTIFNINGRALSNDKWVITSTRNLEPIYNHELLFKALRLVKDSSRPLEINIIGEGSLRAYLTTMAEELDPFVTVNFLGRRTQQEIADTLRKTHVFVTTSLSDGNNISLNEAMACGCVSIATDIAANRQWLQEGVNGMLTPVDDPKMFADKLATCFSDFLRLQSVAIDFNQKIIAEKALWPTNMARVEAKYSQLTGIQI